MKKSILILLLLTSALFANKKTKQNVTVKDKMPSTGIKAEVGNHLIIEASGIVTLTKKGQRARYNVVGASEKGTLLLGLNPKVNEGAFKVQLAKGAKIKFIDPEDQQDGSAKTDVDGHLLVVNTGKTEIGGYLMIVASDIVTVWADSWPPPITKNDNEADLFIVKAFGLLISYGEIKLKKP
ncbi:MAG: hypothetical protein CMJ76_01225 [Planctomycetaceae bacterium]|nr:hypothetical protein [Planctomycetaceae bacterium]